MAQCKYKRCKKEFKPRNNWQEYCQSKCRDADHNEKKRRKKRQQDISAGERGKQRGLDLVEQNNQEFIGTYRCKAIKRCQFKGAVSIVDVRRMAEEDGVKPKSPLAYSGVLRCPELIPYSNKFVQTEHPSGHRRSVRVYRLRKRKMKKVA